MIISNNLSYTKSFNQLNLQTMKKRYSNFPFNSLLLFLCLFSYSNLATAQAFITGNVDENTAVSNFDLTTPNYDDWAIWGVGTSTSLSPWTRKSGASDISELTATTNGYPLRGLGQYSINHSFTYTDGSPFGSATNQRCGIQINNPNTGMGIGTGFEFTIPASTEERQVIIYAGHHRCEGSVTATLSDGSAPPLTLTATTFGQNMRAVFTFNYKSNSDAQTLHLNLFVSAHNHPNTANPNPQIYAVTVENLNPMPVELISFTGKRVGKVSQLNWATATEEQNEGFEIERSLDGQSWRSIGFVQGNGTTSEFNPYSFVDQNPALGTNYYRLKQMDFDGRFEYSDVQSVLFESKDDAPVLIFPNPSTGRFTLKIDSHEAQNASIKLMDLSGRLIFSEILSDPNAILNWNRVFDLPPGQVYFTVIQLGEEIYYDKIYVNDVD